MLQTSLITLWSPKRVLLAATVTQIAIIPAVEQAQ
jgi:hypothetical protein